MKKLVLIISAIASSHLLFVGVSANSDSLSSTCKRCVEFNKVRKNINFEDDETLDPARSLLERFKFSKQKEQRQLEVEAYLDLALMIMKQDSTGNSHSYLYSAYSEQPNEFKKAIDKLPAKSKKYVEESLEQTQKVFEEGNG